MMNWNPWHGCTKISTGCQNCIMYREDIGHGVNPSVVHKTKSFDLPLKKNRKGDWKIPSGQTVNTCATSDFFHPAADAWRRDAWAIIKARSDLKFLILTKRPDRFYSSLPDDWEDGYPNVTLGCTCENQFWADERLPYFFSLPAAHKEIILEPMLGNIRLDPYFEKYAKQIERVVVGGETGEGRDIRPLDYGWVIMMRTQCTLYDVPLHFHQTGTYLLRGRKFYFIPRDKQEDQALRSGLDSAV